MQQGDLEGGAEGGAGQLPDCCQQEGVGLLVLGEPSLVLQAVPQLQAGGGAGQGQRGTVGSRRGEVFLVEWRAEVCQLEEIYTHQTKGGQGFMDHSGLVTFKVWPYIITLSTDSLLLESSPET